MHICLISLQLCFKRHYSSESGGDKCTLFCDRNNINRRNVKCDVTSAYSPDRAMFTLAVKARIVVAALEILGMSDISGKPTRNTFPLSLPTASEATQRVYLRAIAAKVVDTYAIDSLSVNALLNQILSEEEQDEVQKNQAQTPDGRYPCRVPGCHKSFRFDGKSRRKHELTHGDHAELSSEAFMETKDTAQTTKAKEPNKSSDDMFNYQCSLLDHGLLYLNFRDAVAEGDGARIIRCWKFLLIQFWQESRKSKYALEALYLLFQIHALLTPCEAHQLVWNRSVNNHGVAGCNVSLDLDLEHDNNYIKEGNKKMGRNLTTTAVTRNCHCCKVAREIIEQYDLECKIRKRSGKHVQKSDGEDLRILVNLLLSEGALIETPGREYNNYAAFQRSQTSEIDMSSLFKWIDNHKKYILFNRRAR